MSEERLSKTEASETMHSISLSFTSLPLALNREAVGAQQALNTLIALAPPPHGTPCLETAVNGLRKCVKAVLDQLNEFSEPAALIKENFEELAVVLKAALSRSGQAEVAGGINGTKTRHPEWCLMRTLGRSNHNVASTYVGLKSLLALKDGKRLAKSAVERATRLLQEDDLAPKQIRLLLDGVAQEEHFGQSWPRDMARAWRDVIRAFGVDTDPPTPSTKDRVAGQLLDGILNTTAGRRGGARSHRQHSNSQSKNSLRHIGREIENDSLPGALGCIVALTGFSVDLAAELPLCSGSLDSSWHAQIDLESGLLRLDYGILFPEAAAPLPGSIPSSYIVLKPLPSDLAKNLRKRLKKYPEARKLADLYQGEFVPSQESAVYLSHDMIAPSWARFRQTCGSFLREAGMNSLLAAIVSGHFMHVPRSKLYYACVETEELSTAFSSFFQMSGWGAPVNMPSNALAFGAKVIPSVETLRTHDQHLKDLCLAIKPAKRTGLAQLLEFHNRFVQVSGSRLTLLLALRESKEIHLLADIQEELDKWTAIHDKDVPGRNYPLPVVLATFAAQTLDAIRRHSRALRGRLINMGFGKSELARWCAQIGKHGPVSLLSLASSPERLRPLATRDLLRSKSKDYKLAPDFGRKAMENLLRHEGLHATEIDAFLRHAVAGQARQSATSHGDNSSLWCRSNDAINRIAGELFGPVLFGLSKD